MSDEKTEGLLIQAIPYLGSQKILKILTPQDGLVTLMVKNKSLLPLTDPFLIAEWVFKKGNSSLYRLLDASLINPLSHLRSSYTSLMAAGEIGQALLRSQFPEKKGGGLYALAISYLQKISSFSNPAILSSSFYLKLLMHDGLLGMQNECVECGEKASALSFGESFCEKHGLFEKMSFLPKEWEVLQELVFARSFQKMEKLELDKTAKEKIKILFDRLVSQ